METFATAVAGPLRCVLSRIALMGGGEAFFFSFWDEAQLAAGPVTPSIPIDAALARSALAANAAPANDAEHVATIAKVIDDGPVRSALNIGQPGSGNPWIVQAFFEQIDALEQARQIAAATPGPGAAAGPAPSPWSKPGGAI
ncbi:hypothetical protein [Ramlibacter sp.]|uniref:hypothetical protein n=1 Tax=Ramlibacter sp. TaxID=1917967 RepID=UPI003D1417A6